MEERFKFRHVNAITGTFVLLVLCITVGAIVFAGKSQRWFIGNVPLQILLPEAGAAGIRDGSEVYFLGTLVGSVSDVTLDQKGRMRADVKIRKDYFPFVRTDSSVAVKRKFGLVGDAFFEITRGNEARLPEKNATIVCDELQPSVLESAIQEVRREAVPALQKLSIGLEKWTELGGELSRTSRRLEEVIERMNQVVARLEKGEGTAGRLLTDSSAADELNQLLQDLRTTVDHLQPTLDNLEQASDHVRQASEPLPGITEAIGKGSTQFPALVDQTRVSMHELERLLTGLQKHWLVRRYMQQNSDGTREKPARNRRSAPPTNGSAKGGGVRSGQP